MNPTLPHSGYQEENLPRVMIIQPNNDILQFPSLKSPCSKKSTPTLKNYAQLGPNSYQNFPEGDSTLQQKKLRQSRREKHPNNKKSPLQFVFRTSISLNSPNKEIFPQGIKVISQTLLLTHEMCPELRENCSTREFVVLPRLSIPFSLVEQFLHAISSHNRQFDVSLWITEPKMSESNHIRSRSTTDNKISNTLKKSCYQSMRL